MIELRSVRKAFSGKIVLKDVNLLLHRGEVAMICGTSGSGKTTLLRTLNRMEPIDSGDICIEGESLYAPALDLCALRARVGLVFQHCNLFSHLTALDNVMLPLVKVKRITKLEARRKALALLEQFSVAHRAAAYPDRLSGGERQRVAIVRCLAMCPAVMLFDEPTSALDWRLRDEVAANIRRLAELKITQFVVTHDLDFACATGDRFFLLEEGQLSEVDCATLACRTTDRVGRMAYQARAQALAMAMA